MQKQARYTTNDVIPEDASGDAEFQRVVQQIEELQHPRGYVHAKGAFDKADQAYLRDAEERRKYVEEALVEKERAEFLAAQARVANAKREQLAPQLLDSRSSRGKAQKENSHEERSKYVNNIFVSVSHLHQIPIFICYLQIFHSLCRYMKRWHPIKYIKRTQAVENGGPPGQLDSSPRASKEESPSDTEAREIGLKSLLGAYESDNSEDCFRPVVEEK